MNPIQRRPARLVPRDLSPGETSMAFLGMAHVLKEAFVRVGSHRDLAILKASLIHRVKNATMSTRGVRNEIAVLDTIIDLIEIAYDRADEILAHDPSARPQRE